MYNINKIIHNIIQKRNKKIISGNINIIIKEF